MSQHRGNDLTTEGLSQDKGHLESPNTDPITRTEIILGDSLEIMKSLELPANTVVITDPPYPDYLADEYKYFDGVLDFLKDLPYRQLIFWSCRADFPLDYTAIHIWDKKVPTTPYERIFERNGKTHYRHFSDYLINSPVAAQYARDIFNEHPSQKPVRLMKKLVNEFSDPDSLILDPFAGSGTTLLAAKDLGHPYIGIEINPEYIKIAEQRLRQEVLL
jgi:DNA modification methylase